MKVMVFVKATADSEAGKMPSEELFRDMNAFNEKLNAAGVILAGEGLHPSVAGKRVRCEGKNRTVIDGPFAETKEIVSGFWIWQVKSIDEAIDWIRQSPFVDGELEIRPIFTAEDFGEALPDDVREAGEKLAADIARRNA